ncbi:cell envelope integrity protein CreD [Rhizobium sp. KVB221]|uniref:Cell envelope integrity protein CreD n=1 Tax=Rhizobium setariae TaxID=2801340 RepID=A0A936YKK8_9HYPH|nr:cell envelope integrity protein CreD [Rhizobium setariae]MBL0371298.1 cell envelope integrity protein CreD [Rhizobium setariae]
MTTQDEADREADLPPPDFTNQREQGRPGSFAAFMRLPGVKFIIVGIISVMLLVPTLLVWAMVEERSQRATEVSQKIAAGWGGEQVVNGPYLAVPISVNRSHTNQNGSVTWQRETEWMLLMPEELNIDTTLVTEARKLSIYSLPVYNAKLSIRGAFAASMKDNLARLEGTPDLDNAFLVMNIGDITGIRSDAEIRFDDDVAQAFEPGMKGIVSSRPSFSSYQYGDPQRSETGINRPVTRAMIEKGFAFDMELSLNGSGRLSVAPAGQTTRLEVAANWPDPGFEGLYLPESKTIDAKGFKAGWTIPYLARGIDKVSWGQAMPLAGNLMSVNLVEPVKFYQIVSRTLKYSIGFISLMFFAVFIIELKSGRMVHWVQYVLTGLALIIFYILLLALSEHVGFASAYSIAAIATTLLIATYVGSVTASRKSGLSLAAVLGLTYAVMYLILREDEYALLAGAIISFVTIAVTMYFTRNIDWSGAKQSR